MRLGAATLALLLLLGACSADDADPSTDRHQSSGDHPSSTPASPTPTDQAPEPTGGTASSPLPVEPAVDLLDWQPVPGPVEAEVTRGGPWTLSHEPGGTTATLTGPDPATVRAEGRMRIAETLLDEEYAVVVAQDQREQRPAVATVLDLASGERWTLDGTSDVSTTSGGSWSLGQGSLAHATIGPDRSYCLAGVDLASRDSRVEWCAPKRHGFNGVRITPAGWSLMTFDDSRPSCRTVAQVTDSDLEPFPDVPDCTGWDGALMDGGAIWSVVPDENRIEEVRMLARSDDGYFALGPATSGSLVWCAGAAYFTRDPQREGDPARLLRWSSGGSLDVVYESRGRHAFLAEPRCGGDRLTITVLSDAGDRQLTARVG